MDPFLIKVFALLAIVVLVGKRAIFGPQVLFARTSVSMAVAGVGLLQLATEKADFAATVGAVLLLIGLLLALVMVSLDCVHMIRTNFGKKSD